MRIFFGNFEFDFKKNCASKLVRMQFFHVADQQQDEGGSNLWRVAETSTPDSKARPFYHISINSTPASNLVAESFFFRCSNFSFPHAYSKPPPAVSGVISVKKKDFNYI